MLPRVMPCGLVGTQNGEKRHRNRLLWRETGAKGKEQLAEEWGLPTTAEKHKNHKRAEHKEMGRIYERNFTFF